MAKQRRKHRGVYERVPGSGEWYIRFKVRGRIVRRKIGPYSLALEEYSKARAKVAEGTYRHEARKRNPILAAYLDEYLDRNGHRLRSVATVERHARTWKRALGERTLREIEVRDIERYVGRRATEVSAASVNRELALLKAVFNAAMRDRLVFENPIRAIKFFQERPRVRFLTEEEEPRLRTEIGEDSWRLVELAIHVGFRQGEQFRLRWTDVDFANRVATIPRSKGGHV
jgi:integrase